jgi:hypothetical protein
MQRCEECKAPIVEGTIRFAANDETYVESPEIIYCDLCMAMVDSIRKCPGILEAANDWREENVRRIQAKKRMLSSQE